MSSFNKENQIKLDALKEDISKRDLSNKHYNERLYEAILNLTEKPNPFNFKPNLQNSITSFGHHHRNKISDDFNIPDQSDHPVTTRRDEDKVDQNTKEAIFPILDKIEYQVPGNKLSSKSEFIGNDKNSSNSNIKRIPQIMQYTNKNSINKSPIELSSMLNDLNEINYFNAKFK